MPVGEWYGGETRCIFVPPVSAHQNSKKLIVNVEGKGDARDETDKFRIYHVKLNNLSAVDMLSYLRDEDNATFINNNLWGTLRKR